MYGSDAVAGVVNFILRSDYQGAEFSANYGISDKDDGESKGYQFTFGQSSDKGSIMAGISYNKTEQVLAGHRDFSKNSVSLYGTNGCRLTARRMDSSPKGSIGGSTSSAFGHIQTPDAFRDIYPIARSSRAIPARPARTSRPTTTATSTTDRGRPERQVQLRDGQPDHDAAGTHGPLPERQLQADRQRRSVCRRSCTTRPRRRSSWRPTR